jgi:hypothetical protein
MCMLPLTVYDLYTNMVTFAHLHHFRRTPLKNRCLPMCPFVCFPMQLLFYEAIVVIVDRIKTTLGRSATYTVLDTHEKGYHKCPTAKIDVSLSNSPEVREFCTNVFSAWASLFAVVVYMLAMREEQQVIHTAVICETPSMSCAHRHYGRL